MVPDNNVLLFFHEPLAAGKKYKISFSGKAQEVLYDMISAKQYNSVNYLMRTMDHAEEVDLIAYIPRTIRADLKQESGPLPPGMVWKEGTELTNADLADLSNAFPEFHPIGWRGKALNRGDAIGFRAYSA